MTLLVVLFMMSLPAKADVITPDLFGYMQYSTHAPSSFPHFSDAIKRQNNHKQAASGSRESCRRDCNPDWTRFLSAVEQLPQEEQLHQVNAFVNTARYMQDIENYEQEDYWAIPSELFSRGGDCEDFALAKFFALRQLGFEQSSMRIVVLQDTEKAQPHAVLAIAYNGDTLILDNQASSIRSHSEIDHYVPVYSLSETQWWLHADNSNRRVASAPESGD